MIGSIFCLMLLTPDAPAARVPSARGAVTPPAALLVQGRSSIIGSVYNQEGRPIHNVRVELLDEVDGPIASAYTDAGGKYYFYNLTQGTFQVRVNAGGTEYQSRSERVYIAGSLAGGRGAQSEQVDIVLPYKEKRGAGPNAAPGAVFAQEVPKAAQESYQRALRQLDDEKSREQGLASLQQAVKLFPDYFDALDLLGQEHIKRSNFQEAQPVLARAVTVNPRSFSSWYSLGYTQYKLRQLPAAVESLTKSAALNPKSINTYLILGTAQRLQKQWAAAEEQLKRAKSLTKKPPAEVHWQLALLYNQTGRNAAAADELELFLKAQPDSRDADKIRKLVADLRNKR